MDVFEYFDLKKDTKSIYKYAPVYKSIIDTEEVIIKRTKEQTDRLANLLTWQQTIKGSGIETILPIAFKKKFYHSIGTENWVVYPFIKGNKYQANEEQIHGAGELLGRIHATSDSVFEHGFSWENYDGEFYDEVAEDIQIISKCYPTEFNSHEGQKLFRAIALEASKRFSNLARQELPTSDCTWDFKASNLVYQTNKPVLIDTDNAGKVPRIFDLSLALLLFHTCEDSAPNRVFTPEEWELFLSGYKKHIQMTEIEKESWQSMLLLVYADEVLWAINDLDEDESDRQKDFIRNLVTFNAHQYTI
ncbi:phosphotransferase [Agaribacter flavus]|uniref:Phosphotransferase n=1 Tax=Agaribacter flavus TaxID=1902781 RepID=A0ABV7FM86_9ALTE